MKQIKFSQYLFVFIIFPGVYFFWVWFVEAYIWFGRPTNYSYLVAMSNFLLFLPKKLLATMGYTQPEILNSSLGGIAVAFSGMIIGAILLLFYKLLFEIYTE